MEDNYCGEVVLDSDDERGDPNEAANLVNGHFRAIGRFSGRRSIGLLKRKQVSAAQNYRCSKKSDAGRTCLSNGSRFQDCRASVDNVPSSSTDRRPIPTREYHLDREYLNMVRESVVEDSLDERRLSSHESKDMDVGNDANNGCDRVGLNYIQSPQVSESHDKALEFVDRYLSVSDLGSYKYVETRRTNRMQSPPSLKSKGSQCLARRVNLGCTANKSTAFDWVENPTEKKCDYASPRLNKDSTYVSVNQDSGKVKMQNEIPVPQSKELPGSIWGANNFALKSDGIDKIGSNSGICIAQDSLELDEQFDTGFENVENGEELRLIPDALDSGLNTQMAAEAMEALMHAAPLMVDACLVHQVSDNTVLGSSNTVNEKNNRKHVANQDEAFVSWRCKEKRSKCVKVSTVDHTNASSSAAKKLEYKIVSQKSTTKKPMKGKVLTGRNPRNTRNSFCDDGLKIGAKEASLKLNSDLSSEVNTVTAKEEENFNMELADKTLSKLSTWVYPKRKRSGYCVPYNSIISSNQCSPGTAIGSTVEKNPAVNEETRNRVTELLVYKRRRKISSQSEQIGSSLKSGCHLYSSVKDNAVSDRIQNSIEADNLKSDTVTFQELENSDKSKQTFNPTSKSPLVKELMRLGYTESIPDFPPKDSRRRKDTEKVSILFSQNLNTRILKKQKKIVARLGFSIASCCCDATHFVADRFMRTKNMLEVIALGKPVVTHLWLESCEQAGYVIDEKSYILRDEKKEKEIGFNMAVSLSLASQHPLLKGREVLITPNVKPGMEVVKGLVKAVHGKVVQKTKEKMIADDLLILSCEKDYTICLPFLEKGASIYDSELLLNGIVTQKLEYERYKLFKEFTENGRSSPTLPRRRNGKMARATYP